MPGVVLTLLQLALSPLLLLCWLEWRWSGGERWFITCAELLSLVPGWPGSMLRKAFYRATLRACALRAYIGFGAVVGRRTAEVGEGVYIGPYCIVGSVTLGAGVRLASRVSVPSGRRQHDVGLGAPAEKAPRLVHVTIGEGAWIGEGAIVLADVGRYAVVGAGAVVVRPVADGVTVVGNPARPVRGRGASEPVSSRVAAARGDRTVR